MKTFQWWFLLYRRLLCSDGIPMEVCSEDVSMVVSFISEVLCLVFQWRFVVKTFQWWFLLYRRLLCSDGIPMEVCSEDVSMVVPFISEVAL